MGRWYKQANALANSLGIEPDSYLYKQIQKWEPQLKRDGNWQKIKQVKKNRGKQEAINLFKAVTDSYKGSEETNPKEINDPLVEHVARTPSGGDWYFYENQDNFTDAKTDDRGKVIIDEDKYTELMHEAEKKTIELYAEQIVEMLEEEDEEPELDNWGEPEQTKAEQAKDAARGIASPEELIEFSHNFGHPLEAREVQDEIDSQIELAVYEWKEDLNRRLELHVNAVESIACGGKWCISSGKENATTYIVKGCDFLILRRGGSPRLAVMHHSEEGIKEIKGTDNDYDNVDPIDIVDLYSNPIFSDVDIDSGWEQEGIDAGKVYARIWDFPDDQVTEATAPRINDVLDKLVDEIYEMDEVSNDAEKLFAYMDQWLNFAARYNRNYVHNMFVEKMSKEFSTKEYAYSEFVWGLIDWTRGDSEKQSLEAIKKIAANINEDAIRNFFDEAVAESPGEVPYYADTLKYFFGNRVESYLEAVESPYYNMQSLDTEEILTIIYKGLYKTMDLSKYIRDETELSKIAGYVYHNIPKGISYTNATYLNNLLEMARMLDYGEAPVWFYIDRKMTDMIKHETDKWLEFLVLKEKAGAMPGFGYDPDMARCEKLVGVVDTQMPGLGFSEDIINRIRGDLDYSVCKSRVNQVGTLACNWYRMIK